MTLTLGDLRTYANEVAGPDLSTASGLRESQGWINAALRRVFSAHSWNYLLSADKIVLLPEETGSAMDLTQGSEVVTLTGETFAEKYLTDEWELTVTGEDRMTFTLDEISDPTTASLDYVWTNATSTTTAYTFSKHKYPLPNRAKEVVSVEVVDDQYCPTHLQPHLFDRQKHLNPTERGGTPLYYTIRKHRLEVWPSPAGDYWVLLVSYRRGPQRFTADDIDAVEVDWEEDWSDLLEKAIALEAAITQGESAPIPYAVADREYRKRLSEYKAMDGGFKSLGGSMNKVSYRDSKHISNYPSALEWS